MEAYWRNNYWKLFLRMTARIPQARRLPPTAWGLPVSSPDSCRSPQAETGRDATMADSIVREGL